jgi:hypothetical protein
MFLILVLEFECSSGYVWNTAAIQQVMISC